MATLRFVQDIPLHEGDRGFDLVSATAAGLEQFGDRPVCLFWGGRDFVFDRYFLAVWEKLYPAAEKHLYPDCGHYILEDAGDEIIPLIRNFLDHHPVKAA